MKTLDSQIWLEYTEWLKSKGKATTGMQNIYVNNDNQISVEKKMATKIETATNDWFDFCKEKKYDYPVYQVIVFA